MSSDTPPVESAQDIQVRLKAFWGIAPKYYLAAFYGLLVLVVLFALTLLPGLANPGTRVTITSVPPGASVVYGTKHWGTTPLTVFLPEGSANLTIAKPAFQTDSTPYHSGNNVFLSLFLPSTDTVEVKLKPSSETSIADWTRTEVGRWALAVPFTSDYRFPPLFTEFTTNASAAGWDSAQIKAFLLGLRGAVADPQMYLDYGKALGLWTSTPPEGLKAQYELWDPVVGAASGRLALWLLANQSKPARDRELAEKSDWFQGRINEFIASLPPTTLSPPGNPLKTSFGTFRSVGRSSFLWASDGKSFPLPTDPPFAVPVAVTVSEFWIADREVTQAEFAAFVQSNPQWAPGSRDALVAAGWADGDYLTGWKGGTPAAPSEPVASVSWYAAQAYCDWLNNGRVPRGTKAVLPDEFQWEAAARSAGGASLLNQGVWEWTASAWYPGQSLVWTGTESVREPLAYARSLKGGIQSAKGSVKASDRAGWPATGASPGFGFRVALVGAP